MNDIKNIWQIKESGGFPNYIDYIRLPQFKDIAEDTQINFDFPLTVFVGANGTRKSSVLKGLQGCPKGESPKKYWFSTKLDPILGKNDKRSSIIHGYKNSRGNTVECLKLRATKKGRNWDYWETSRPFKKYGLAGGRRQEPINKPVQYLNFRSLLPAFDKCFFYSDRPVVQDYIRNKSPFLRNVLDSGKVIKIAGKEQNEAPEPLTNKELMHISKILGRDYKQGSYINHKFFSGWAETVVLATEHYSYSEAFAGSGETAVAVLVHKMEKASDGSLIILDEPEVSLHPEAQRRLKDYLIEKVKVNKHQIVISTHSPFIIENLPNEAIKAFRISPETGSTEVTPW